MQVRPDNACQLNMSSYICQGSRQHRNGTDAILGQLQNIRHQLDERHKLVGLGCGCPVGVGFDSIFGTCSSWAWLGDSPLGELHQQAGTDHSPDDSTIQQNELQAFTAVLGKHRTI